MARTIYAFIRRGDTAGSLLRRARGKSGRSQRDMASRVGVTHTTIGSWESDRHPVGPRRIRDVAAAYGVHDLELARASWRGAPAGAA